MSKGNKKGKKILFIAIAICLVALVILLLVLRTETSKEDLTKQYEENIKDFQEFGQKFQSETILPRKIYELYGYNGKYNNEDLFRSMKTFQDYIDYLKENVSVSDSETFYNQNTEDIRDILGMEAYDDFKTFIEELQNHNVEAEQFLYAEVVVGSSHNENGYFIFDINFYYGSEETPDKVTFTVGFSQLDNLGRPMTKYSFKTEE